MKKIIYSLSLILVNGTFAYTQFIVDYAKQISSPSDVLGLAMTVDNSGNVFNAGTFIGTVDLDPGTGVSSVSAVGVDEMYIQKLDVNGNLLWAKTIGGSSDGLTPLSMCHDNLGNIVIVGRFYNTPDVDPGAGTFNLVSTGWADIFVLKLDASGNFLFAKNMGGPNFDEGRAMTVDASGSIYITGIYNTTADFDPNPGIVNLVSTGQGDIFVSKLNSNGDLIWVKSMGGNDINDEYDDYGNGIAVDVNGNVFICGSYGSTADFDPGSGVDNLVCSGYTDGYVQKLDENGNHVWVKRISGPSSIEAKSIALDASNDVVVSGFFIDGAYFDTEYVQGFNNGGLDIFIAKFDDSNNGNLIWAKKMGGSGQDIGFSIATDNLGNIYSTGRFQSSATFFTQASYYTLTCLGITNTFIQRLDSNGFVTWVVQFINGPNSGTVISVDDNDKLYTLGYFQSSVDFDPNAGVLNLTSGGNKDTYVHKMNTNYSVTPILSQTSNFSSFSQTIGVPSGEQTFTVTGSNLTDNIIVAAPVNYEVSLSSGAGFTSSLQLNQTSGTVPNTTIYVRLNAITIGAHNGDITLNSGALSETVSLTGTTGTAGLEEMVKDDIFVYPNPGYNVIHLISVQNTSVTINSINGSILSTLELNGETTIDVSTYAPGVYFIRTAEGQTVKFIKE